MEWKKTQLPWKLPSLTYFVENGKLYNIVEEKQNNNINKEIKYEYNDKSKLWRKIEEKPVIRTDYEIPDQEASTTYIQRKTPPIVN